MVKLAVANAPHGQVDGQVDGQAGWSSWMVKLANALVLVLQCGERGPAYVPAQRPLIYLSVPG